MADGLYDFRAVATDNAGNDTTSTVVEDRRIDNTAPAGSLADPGANLSGSKSMNASASDAGSGVALVKIQRSVAGMGVWTDVCSLSAGPYTCTLDTTLLTDGLFDFRTVTTDNAGNVTNSTVVANRRVDNTPPVSVMTNPGQYLRGNAIPLAATSTDVGGSGVKQVTIQRAPANGSTWTDVCTDTTAAYTCTLDSTTAATPDGLYDFRAVATDNADNVTNSTVVEDRRIDNTAPVATMTDPGQYLRATVALAATATDTGGSGVASVKFQRSPANGNTWTDCTPDDTSAPYNCSLNTTTVTDGLYDFRVIATDLAGNATTSALVEDRTDRQHQADGDRHRLDQRRCHAGPHPDERHPHLHLQRGHGAWHDPDRLERQQPGRPLPAGQQRELGPGRHPDHGRRHDQPRDGHHQPQLHGERARTSTQRWSSATTGPRSGSPSTRSATNASTATAANMSWASSTRPHGPRGQHRDREHAGRDGQRH